MSKAEQYERRRARTVQTLRLYKGHGMTSKEIAPVVGVTQKQMGDILYRLNKKGLIVKTDNKRDEFAVFVHPDYDKRYQEYQVIDEVKVDYQKVADEHGQAIPVFSENGDYEIFWPEGKDVVDISRESVMKIVQFVNASTAQAKTLEARCAMLEARCAMLQAEKAQLKGDE